MNSLQGPSEPSDAMLPLRLIAVDSIPDFGMAINLSLPADGQAIFRRRRSQPRRPPLAKVRSGEARRPPASVPSGLR